MGIRRRYCVILRVSKKNWTRCTPTAAVDNVRRIQHHRTETAVQRYVMQLLLETEGKKICMPTYKTGLPCRRTIAMLGPNAGLYLLVDDMPNLDSVPNPTHAFANVELRTMFPCLETRNVMLFIMYLPEGSKKYNPSKVLHIDSCKTSPKFESAIKLPIIYLRVPAVAFLRVIFSPTSRPSGIF